eukprot:CAMPEP_0181418378 /NCGR_PEP_ID=MMETSP1110-20121109/11526_1 /TAXON_ID=174948 /ORGANISM="Symbiodinium sp., Strain CCMP421" /LENGTH=635 /DNA_ID=CAMNT_0023541359 /DNA_START=60 /DNA_END=1964 /DNA_ORIENTATION=-
MSEGESPANGHYHGAGDFENSSESEGGGDTARADEFESDSEASPSSPTRTAEVMSRSGSGQSPRSEVTRAASDGRTLTAPATGASDKVGIATSGEGSYSDDEFARDDEEEGEYGENDWEDESAASPRKTEPEKETDVLNVSVRGLDSLALGGSMDLSFALQEEELQEPANAAVRSSSVQEATGEPVGAAAKPVETLEEPADRPAESEVADFVRSYVHDLSQQASEQVGRQEPEASQAEEEADEIAAIIAAARAAVDRPAAATTSTWHWDEPSREVEAAASTAGRDAVEFGPVGTPPPDDAPLGWVRDAAVQCGTSGSPSPGEAQRQSSLPAFSAAREAFFVDEVALETKAVQAEVVVREGAAPARELLRNSLSATRLETVDEGEREETPPTPSANPEEAEDHRPSQAPVQASASPLAHKQERGLAAQLTGQRALGQAQSRPSERKAQSRSPPPRSLSPVQPVRPLLPEEQEALYSGLSQAPSGPLAFSRCLQGRRPTPPGSPDPSWSDSEGLAAIPAGHLHRICDPFAKRARPGMGQYRATTPRREHVRRIKPLPRGLESRPPEASLPDVRTEVHSVMAKRRDWLLADTLQIQYPARGPDFMAKRSVAAGAVYYAKPSHSCLQSLGGGGNFPSGR